MDHTDNCCADFGFDDVDGPILPVARREAGGPRPEQFSAVVGVYAVSIDMLKRYNHSRKARNAAIGQHSPPDGGVRLRTVRLVSLR